MNGGYLKNNTNLINYDLRDDIERTLGINFLRDSISFACAGARIWNE